MEFCGVLENEVVEPKVHMKSHFDGEVWGLELVDPEAKQFLTCGDDNKFMLVNSETRQVERQGKISEKKTAAKKDK